MNIFFKKKKNIPLLFLSEKKKKEGLNEETN